MKTIWPVALITLKQGLRYNVLYGVIVFTLLFMTFSVFISGLFMRDILKIILDLCLSAVSIGGLLVPFFLGVTLLSGDIEQKSIYTILARPVSRTHYILGKFTGFSLLTAIIMGILTSATLCTVWGASYVFDPHFLSTFSIRSILLSTSMGLLGTLVLISTVMLWCSITTSSFLATMLTLATYLIGHTIEDVTRFMSAEISGVDISPAIHKVISTTLYIFPNLSAFDLKQLAAHGLPISFYEIFLLSLYGFSYISVMLFLSIIIFQNRDLP